MDCIMYQTGFNPDKSYFMEVIIIGVTPLIISLISVPFWLLFNCLAKRHSSLHLTQDHHLQSENQSSFNAQSSSFAAVRSQGEESPQQEQIDEFQYDSASQRGRTGAAGGGSFRVGNQGESEREVLKEGVVKLRRLKRLEQLVPEKRGSSNQVSVRAKNDVGEENEEKAGNDKAYSPSDSEFQKGLQIQQSQEGNTFPLNRRLMTTFFVVVLLWQPTIINYSFSLFTCIDYEDGASYLRKDTSIKCWTGINYMMQLAIGLSLIGIWGVIFPLVVFLKIRENSGRLGDHQILKLYGIFYIGLNDDSFYWEIIVMNIRKFLLILVATFFSSSLNSFKGYVGILALFIQRHFSHYKQPFIDPRFNQVETLGSFASMCTIFGGLLFLPDSGTSRISAGPTSIKRFSQGEDTFKLLLFAFVLIVNIYFWVHWLSHFITVLIRLHIGKVKRVCLMLGVRILNDRQVVNTYEEDLQKVLEGMKEARVEGEAGPDQVKPPQYKEETGPLDDQVELPEMESLEEIEDYKEEQFKKSEVNAQVGSQLRIDETWGVGGRKRKDPSKKREDVPQFESFMNYNSNTPFVKEPPQNLYQRGNHFRQADSDHLQPIDMKQNKHYLSSYMDSHLGSQIASIQPSLPSSPDPDLSSFYSEIPFKEILVNHVLAAEESRKLGQEIQRVNHQDLKKLHAQLPIMQYSFDYDKCQQAQPVSFQLANNNQDYQPSSSSSNSSSRGNSTGSNYQPSQGGFGDDKISNNNRQH